MILFNNSKYQGLQVIYKTLSALCILVILFIGCSKKEELQTPSHGNNAKIKTTENNSVAKSKKVYLYFPIDNNSNEKLVSEIEMNTVFLLKKNGKDVTVVRHLNDVGKDGILVDIKAIRASKTLRRSVEVLYSIVNNKTKEIIITENKASASFFAGFNKVAIVIGKELANSVERVDGFY